MPSRPGDETPCFAARSPGYQPGVDTATRSETRTAARWLKRSGWVAKGVVYLLTGVLALAVAFRRSGSEASADGALRTLAQQPFGSLLLAALALGLVAYTASRVAEATIYPPEGASLWRRVGYVAESVGYLGVAWLAVRILIGSGGGSGDSSAQTATAVVLGIPGGRYVVGGAGIAMGVAAVFLGVRAWTDRYARRIELGEMSSSLRTATDILGTWGLTARAGAVLLIGWFLVLAAVQFDPQEAQGLDGSLRQLAQEPYGPWVLAVVALGFCAYAALAFIEARYRDIAQAE